MDSCGSQWGMTDWRKEARVTKKLSPRSGSTNTISGFGSGQLEYDQGHSIGAFAFSMTNQDYLDLRRVGGDQLVSFLSCALTLTAKKSFNCPIVQRSGYSASACFPWISPPALPWKWPEKSLAASYKSTTTTHHLSSRQMRFEKMSAPKLSVMVGQARGFLASSSGGDLWVCTQTGPHICTMHPHVAPTAKVSANLSAGQMSTTRNKFAHGYLSYAELENV